MHPELGTYFCLRADVRGAGRGRRAADVRAEVGRGPQNIEPHRTRRPTRRRRVAGCGEDHRLPAVLTGQRRAALGADRVSARARRRQPLRGGSFHRFRPSGYQALAARARAGRLQRRLRANLARYVQRSTHGLHLLRQSQRCATRWPAARRPVVQHGLGWHLASRFFCQ